MNRRDFLTTASITSAAVALNGCNESNRQALDYSKHPKKN
ncbi:MAG: twin-arginine translocation signal domain-containing protein [Sulfurimonas sp.]